MQTQSTLKFQNYLDSPNSVEKIQKHSSKILNLDLDQKKTLDEIDQDDNPNKLN